MSSDDPLAQAMLTRDSHHRGKYYFVRIYRFTYINCLCLLNLECFFFQLGTDLPSFRGALLGQLGGLWKLLVNKCADLLDISAKPTSISCGFRGIPSEMMQFLSRNFIYIDDYRNFTDTLIFYGIFCNAFFAEFYHNSIN